MPRICKYMIMCTLILLHLPNICNDDTVFIWDIKDTLYTRNELKLTEQLPWNRIYKELGTWNASSALFYAGSSQLLGSRLTTREEILNILYQQNGHGAPVYYDNQPLPHIIQQWLTGKSTPENAIRTAKDGIHQHSSVQKHTKLLAPYIIPLMFSPSAIAATFIPNDNVLPILTDITTMSNCHNSIFSNLHNEVITELRNDPKKRHMISAHYFAPNAIHTSYDFQHLKPQPEAIKKVADSHGVSLENCIVIESEQQHCTTLKKHDIHSILYSDSQQLQSDIESVISQRR